MRGAGPGAVAEARRLLAALERFYAPAGLYGAATAEPAPGALVGRIGGDGPLDGRLDWGAPFGASAPTAAELLAMGDGALRGRVVGFGCSIAWRDGAARIVTAPSGPLGLHVAEGPDRTAWATHAVAAAWLARGTAEVDPEALPELLAFDFAGGRRTLVAGVEAVAPAHELDVARGTARCWWPPAERWAPVAPAQAHEHAAEALLATLDRGLPAAAPAALALTAGADSRVLAVAVAELGRPATAFCWGEDGWPDVEGARAVSAALDMPFSAGARWRADDALRAALDADARWTDGGLGVALADRTWPAGAPVLVGMAGEVGRAFYYRAASRRPPPADDDAAAALLAPEGRLPHAGADAHRLARDAVGAWVAEAAGAGHAGWRLLDVLYAEQRVARWGRHQVPVLGADYLAGFAPMEVLRGLVSLPLGARVSDGFHRRFVAGHRPALALPAPAPAPVPRPWRAAAGRAAGLLGRRARGVPASPEADPLLAAAWAQRPTTRAWIAEEALAHPLLISVLGAAWVDATRAGFLRGERRATEQATLACGPVALAAALAELRDDPSTPGVGDQTGA